MIGSVTDIGQFLIPSEREEEKNTSLQFHTGRTEYFSIRVDLVYLVYPNMIWWQNDYWLVENILGHDDWIYVCCTNIMTRKIKFNAKESLNPWICADDAVVRHSCRRNEDPYRSLETAKTKRRKMRKDDRDLSNFALAIQYIVKARVLTVWSCPRTPNTTRTPRKSCTACMLPPLLSTHNAVLNKQLIFFTPPGSPSPKTCQFLANAIDFCMVLCVMCFRTLVTCELLT